MLCAHTHHQAPMATITAPYDSNDDLREQQKQVADKQAPFRGPPFLRALQQAQHCRLSFLFSVSALVCRWFLLGLTRVSPLERWPCPLSCGSCSRPL